MSEFDVSTAVFEIFYDRPKEDGGGYLYNSLYTDCLEIVDAPRHYGLYDCFFDCVHYLLVVKDKLDVSTLRRKMRISNKIEVPIRCIKRFERAANIKVIVYKDSIVNGVLFEAYSLSFKSRFEVKLVLHNSHYYVYKGVLDSNKRYYGDKLEHFDHIEYSNFLFYDLETYIKPSDHNITPYLMLYYFYSKGMDVRGVIGKMDLNDDITSRIYQTIHNLVGDKKVLLVGYNNSAFDDYILIDILSKYSKKLLDNVIDRHGRILEFSYNNMKSKDMYKFMMTSLRNATISFKCSVTKSSFDHIKVQKYVNNGTFDTWINNNQNILYEYII